MNLPGITEEELQAHVDGRLDPARAEAVAAALAGHPELAARVAAWRIQRSAIADAYAALVDEPVPARLRQAAAGPEGAGAAAPGRTAALLPGHIRFALAAMLVGGVAIGWVVRGAVPFAGPAAVSTAAALPREAALAHAVFSPEIRHPVEVAASDQDHLVGWLSKRLGHRLVVPDLAAAGYELVGGRLLPGEQGPAAQFMYQDAAGRRLTLYVRAEPTSVPATAFRFTEQGALRVFHWVDGALGYALSGELARDELLALATRVHRQIAS